jgi:hypothetical protein
MLDALTAHIALVDGQGTIVFVNQAWNRFAVENGDPELAFTGVGANYFASCLPLPDDISAVAAVEGMRKVLGGASDFFEMEYPCHAPTELRWFLLQVTPLQLHGDRALLVSHNNITHRRLAWSAAFAETDRMRQDTASSSQELDSLARLSGASPAAMTARTFGVLPLSESMPDIFRDLTERYAQVLDMALEQRTYKVQHPISRELRVVAERLGFARAGPRDVIDVHTHALRTKLGRGERVVHAYFDESRVLLLELMGYLASYYRTYAVGVRQEPGAHNPGLEEGER